MEILMLIITTLFIVTILFLGLKISVYQYTFLGVCSVCFLFLSLLYYESVKGYPTLDDISLDRETTLVYATHNDDYIFYWLLEEGHLEPRAYKVPFTSEEQKSMNKANQAIKKGKKIVLKSKRMGDEDGGRIFIEIDVSQMYKKR